MKKDKPIKTLSENDDIVSEADDTTVAEEVISLGTSPFDDSDGIDVSNKKVFISGIRPNLPPKTSWADKKEIVKFKAGDIIVSKNPNSTLVYKVCSPGKDINTYYAKLSGSMNESLIDGKGFIISSGSITWIPYMDEYTKWKLSQSKKII